MKVGIIADVHSNLIALKKVYEEFERNKVEKIICLGDMIGIGPYPEETMKYIIENKEKMICVVGNHEKYFLEGLPETVHDDKRKLSENEIANHKWMHSQLSIESENFLKTLPKEKILKIENKIIYISHYPLNENNEYKVPIKKPTLDQCEEMFLGIDADIFLCGHSHSKFSYKNKNKIYINPGSLGCPKGSNIANAVIMDIKKDNIEYELLNIEYDVNLVINEINNKQYPAYKSMLRIFYGIE
ncbi:MAG: YfcE family phosphodiesterase [Clostridiales bacterium]|nr:YfcE family phosphodiesterase [Clostridiales bacterium]